MRLAQCPNIPRQEMCTSRIAEYVNSSNLERFPRFSNPIRTISMANSSIDLDMSFLHTIIRVGGGQVWRLSTIRAPTRISINSLLKTGACIAVNYRLVTPTAAAARPQRPKFCPLGRRPYGKNQYRISPLIRSHSAEGLARRPTARRQSRRLYPPSR